MKRISFFIERIPTYVLWLFSFLFIRKKNRWCFGSQSGFSASNTKYLYYQILKEHPEISAAWISPKKDTTYETLKAKGLPVFYKWSLEGLWFCLTAKVYFYTHGPGDVNFCTSGGSYKVNLWHGVGTKNIEYLAQLSWVNLKNPIHRIIFPFYCTYHDILIATSDPIKKWLSDCFRIPLDSKQFVMTNLPRCETSRMEKDELQRLIHIGDENLLPFIDVAKKYNRVFFYMPTYRQDAQNNVLESSKINFGQLNDLLAKKNDFLFIKLHPRDLKKITKNYEYSNIKIVKDLIDIYLLFPYINVLITDYSSVYAEYILYKDNVIIFDFDRDDFLKKEQGLYFDFDEFTSAIFAHNYEMLYGLIKDKETYPVPNKTDMMNKYWNRINETPDLVKEIKSRISL